MVEYPTSAADLGFISFIYACKSKVWLFLWLSCTFCMFSSWVLGYYFTFKISCLLHPNALLYILIFCLLLGPFYLCFLCRFIVSLLNFSILSSFFNIFFNVSIYSLNLILKNWLSLSFPSTLCLCFLGHILRH